MKYCLDESYLTYLKNQTIEKKIKSRSIVNTLLVTYVAVVSIVGMFVLMM